MLRKFNKRRRPEGIDDIGNLKGGQDFLLRYVCKLVSIYQLRLREEFRGLREILEEIKKGEAQRGGSGDVGE